mmetsp:Transcript_12767/g.29997  ORF Transcript_12767/g.29997 Transcript_12767/m.29997 type:complete len:309 (+) Transcript_12767:587-1513(+)
MKSAGAVERSIGDVPAYLAASTSVHHWSCRAVSHSRPASLYARSTASNPPSCRLSSSSLAVPTLRPSDAPGLLLAAGRVPSKLLSAGNASRWCATPGAGPAASLALHVRVPCPTLDAAGRPKPNPSRSPRSANASRARNHARAITSTPADSPAVAPLACASLASPRPAVVGLACSANRPASGAIRSPSVALALALALALAPAPALLSSIPSLSPPPRHTTCAPLAAACARTPSTEVWTSLVCAKVEPVLHGNASPTNRRLSVAPEVNTSTYSSSSAPKNLKSRRRTRSTASMVGPAAGPVEWGLAATN